MKTSVVVIAALEGSPAADAGVVSGAALLAVNGESTALLDSKPPQHACEGMWERRFC